MSDVHADVGTGDCAITVLHSRGPRLAKLLQADGSIVDYDDALTFDATEIVVRNLRDAARVLNGRGTRQIDPDEVEDALDWARARTAGRIAA